MTTPPPSGEVTFLFTDIEGSTSLWETSPESMSAALAEHDRLVRAIVDRHSGYVFTTSGDSFAVAFARPIDALSAAIEIQLAMRAPHSDLQLRVRMGLHTGTASLRDGDYFGAPVNRCARLMSTAHGGQVVLSRSTTRLVVSELPDRVELLDLGEHRLRDLTDPERIHQVCHPDLGSSFPRLRSLEGPGDSLPTQLTSFVGREREIAAVMSLLDEHRLVTLSGAGGAGKTRLALQVAEACVPAFPEGVRFAELAALFDEDVFVNEVAECFRATAVTDVPLVTSIAETVGRRRMLLILDNCEQIIDHVASLTRNLLVACPNLRVIATSRERLAITGEVVYRVPPLSTPAADADAATSIEFDAVRLFVDRARLVVPAFELTPVNVGDVVAVCQRLDGIPLAIELAAARVRSMSPAQISTRLDERFRLLATKERSVSSRQQTLLRTIEWSHDLLGERERIAFRRLGVFVSDFSLEAAEQVVPGDELSALDVLELVTGLVDKSMVTTESGSDGTTRYQLLESIREFALRMLEGASERRDTSLRHARYHADFAELLQVMYRRGDLAEALVLLEESEDNVRASLRFTIETHEWVLAARFVSALGYLWYSAGTNREGSQWCRDLFDAAPELPDVVRAGALHSYALMLATTGRPDLGIATLHEEIGLRRQLGDPIRLGAALNNLGNLLSDVNDLEKAETVLLEAVECFREAGESPSLILSTLAHTAMHTARYDDCENLYRDALRESRAVDDAYGIAVAMGGLGKCLVLKNNSEQARLELVDARERFVKLHVPPGIADADLSLAMVERVEGAPMESARHLHAALTAPGDTWDDEADYWVAQLTASVIDDLGAAAFLIGAVVAYYEKRNVSQAMWVVQDLEQTSEVLRTALGADEYRRRHAAGGRRSRPEILQLTTEALEAFIERREMAT